jgi:hypothetical protein
MRSKSRGRGTAAAFGFVLLICGLLGGGVLFVLANGMADRAIDDFARASPGCPTTLEFTDTGTFYLYEERAPASFTPVAGCTPSATSGQAFSFALSGPNTVTPTPDASIVYAAGGFVGVSSARFEIDEPGTYSLSVIAADVTTLGAVGRDPDDGVASARRSALLVGIVGVMLGVILLLFAGWRSNRAAVATPPDAAPWDGVIDKDAAWSHDVPERSPINPHQPDAPVTAAPPPPPLPARARGAGMPAHGWAPPPAGAHPVSEDAPLPQQPVRTPRPRPVLPDSAGSASGQWPPSPPRLRDGDDR